MTRKNELNKNNVQWLKTIEAADYLGVTTRTMANYRSRGQIAFAQIGRVIRYRKSDLDDFLYSHFVQPSNWEGGVS